MFWSLHNQSDLTI